MEHDIFRLDIAMHHLMHVSIMQCICKLSGDQAGPAWRNAGMVFYPLPQGVAFNQFAHDIENTVRLTHVKNAHNVLVPQPPDNQVILKLP